MLDPRDRRLFVESLRPPSGYALDIALGTTYSLDLAALVSVPLAITLYDHLSEEDREPDPLALLAAVRRCADRVNVFCQAGQIYLPRSQRTLFSYLEKSVFEVLPKAGVFHPKLWFLRFSAPDAPVFYRVIVASRNLTFDRSWDTMLVLEGELADRKLAFGRNHPLADFVAALPDLALRPITRSARKSVRVVSEELRKVRFELPKGIEEVRFWPLGLSDTNPDPFQGRIDRMMVISPFLTEPVLNDFADRGRNNVLVSRLETLSYMGKETLDRFAQVLVMPDNGDPEPDEEEADLAPEATTAQAPDVEVDVPSGLHAKVYVADAGWKSRLWMGSPNATNPGFGRNVEFLVELIGGKYTCGVDAVLGNEAKSTGLWQLVDGFVPDEPTTTSTEEMILARQLDEVRKLIAGSKPVVRVEELKEKDTYRLTVRASATKLRRALRQGVEAKCWPITVDSPKAVSFSAPPGDGGGTPDIAVFPTMSFAALTSFFAFEVSARLGETEKSVSFVLNLPLEGLPADRDERLMLTILQDREQVLRYLLMLLFATDEQLAGEGLHLWDPEHEGAGNGLLELPLFESLLKALHRDPAQLDSVAQLVNDLKKTEQGRKLLPEEFEKVWEPIERARAEL